MKIVQNLEPEPSRFFDIFGPENLIVFVPKKCKNALSVGPKSQIQMSKVGWKAIRLHAIHLGDLGPLKQLKFYDKNS